ncbi:hypothetical protein QA639_25425 [Bradyrhizobium pachyrhizi]|uniref:hypothetical protein n=1 Tax=Bradyrhizobium pachyrhizi TaxID=280333 RepID=UPI0024B1C4FE|nr:hypothetical protein [Bradyrhizobium pachyrhizi]WFU53016.1 hypothetical protein QA639_25425 [Bradyrhizobium pachyrhizi]
MKNPQAMSLAELAQEMNKREDSLDHLIAKAEIVRRQTEAQLEATRATTRNASYMLVSVIVAALSAVAAAVSAYFAYLASLPK